jgi:hypothetical protein
VNFRQAISVFNLLFFQVLLKASKRGSNILEGFRGYNTLPLFVDPLSTAFLLLEDLVAEETTGHVDQLIAFNGFSLFFISLNLTLNVILRNIYGGNFCVVDSLVSLFVLKTEPTVCECTLGNLRCTSIKRFN